MAKALSGSTTAEKLNGIHACEEEVTWAGTKTLTECWAQVPDVSWLVSLAWHLADSQQEKVAVLSAVSFAVRSDPTVRQSAPLVGALDSIDAFLKDPTPSGYGLLKKRNVAVNTVISANTQTEENQNVNLALKHGGQVIRTLLSIAMDLGITGGEKALALLQLTCELLVATYVASGGGTRADAEAKLVTMLRPKLSFAEAVL